MVDRPTKQAMQGVWQEPWLLATFLALLRSASSRVAEKTAVLLGNMCGEPPLRQAIEVHEQLLQCLLQLMTGRHADADLALCQAAATTLFNLVIDPAGQKAVAADS